MQNDFLCKISLKLYTPAALALDVDFITIENDEKSKKLNFSTLLLAISNNCVLQQRIHISD